MTDLSSNEALDKFIAEMWRKNYSSNQIASAVSVEGRPMTRNAVIGRIYRMQMKGVLDKKKTVQVLRNVSIDLRHVGDKLDAPLKKVKRQFIPDRLIKADMISARKSKHTELRLVNPDTGEGVTIDKLSPGGCRWVMDFKRNGLAVFCNDPEHKRSFCEAHYKICYQPVPPKKLKSVGWVKVRF